MRTVAILPVKSFGEAKRRLAEELTAGVRRALAEAMFSDVLVALRRVPGLDQILVVTGDHGAQQIAGGYGAAVLDDDESGHNAAARRGVREALAFGADRALLAPGDCPLLRPEEIEQMLARAVARRSALIVPDRHGTGTNALLLTPPDALVPAFGPGSCHRHETDARAAGAEPTIVRIESLALDVDTPEDLAALQEALRTTHGGAAHTRGMLAQLAHSRA